MTSRLAFAAALCALALPGAASALTCYTLLDRNDNVVYRDTYPPIDLSERGVAERERMRSRGEHLIAMETDRCPNVEFFTGAAGTPSLDVDAVVNGMPTRRAAVAAPASPAGKSAPAAAPARGATRR
jgi:hypothetical protein